MPALIRVMRPSKLGIRLGEAVLAVVLGAFLANTVLPPVTAAIREARLRASATELYAGLNTGRIAAIERNTPIVVCPMAASPAGRPTCARKTQDWAGGWIVFERTADDPTAGIDAARLVAWHPALPTGVAARETRGLTRVTFYPDGTARSEAVFEFSAPDSRADVAARELRVARQGHLRLRERGSDAT